MSRLFHKKTPQEIVREQKLNISKSIREITRESKRLEREEVRLTNEIRKMARLGRTNTVKVMAADLVKTKKQIDKLQVVIAQLNSTKMKLTEMSSMVAVTEAMNGVTNAMRKVNEATKLPAMQKVMNDFEKQNAELGIKNTMVSDMVNEGYEGDDIEEETELEVDKVLTEIGLDVENGLKPVPETRQRNTRLKERRQVQMEGGVKTRNEGNEQPEDLDTPGSRVPKAFNEGEDDEDEDDIVSRIANL
ncbi:SNF7 family protein [Entamoeba histolytica HM-1:IMSS-B]|uniref:SNF7 family protein n=6 Tax=Entamoeba histolytica TaxID=5759 RepID=C4LZV3_ENTH1|nr:SNF7 family protein [Entamoeba histolytica HM-1:IMSS]EMD47786.1 SNF7 family protein [Entamoeba histolytica KU27]EMH74935.1 SNF7 family protein [Entamoeba histolytica HM-1:IMSS-B]EMS14011.1 SNF7 family protein [Entamoeba histolytica HM-3:IMSS]ENY64540.1 SNF7 family protein, putative [Entamoeba histolytica HM-1:IMSS-A]BAN38364.1 SNF7 family protein [Entamoeba histolytica]|eukprot:XP_654699.1 SNF7 family protein [Entamoeba histolytica HM-1:IMSS]